MTSIPASTDVQFGPPPSGQFYVDTFVDPSGNPINVIDIDLGATLSGRVTLPGDLTGTGHVRLAADEIGGPFDGTVKEVLVNLTGNQSPNDPPAKTYNWSLTFKSPDLPDESKAYHFALTFVVTNPGQGHTDIGAIVDLGDFLVV
jgi:hypothetical protein